MCWQAKGAKMTSEEGVNSQVLFKYTDYDGATKTLAGGSIKLSSPSAFNDPFDMLLTDVVGTELEEFLDDLRLAQFEFICSDIDYERLRDGPHRDKIILMNRAMKQSSPEGREAIKRKIQDIPRNELWDLDVITKHNEEDAEHLRNQFERWGIFCTSAKNHSLLMWAHYANHHRGAVLEFHPDLDRDSVLRLSKSVKYVATRPALYQTAKDMVERTFVNPLLDSIREMMDRVIYTKSPEWSMRESIA